MYLPTQPDMASAEMLRAAGSSGHSPSGGWSSLIGIVTAICGNLLISLALNTQRWAHMRLSRQRDEWELKRRRKPRRRDDGSRTYGTQQQDIAERRAELNAKSVAAGGANEPYVFRDPAEGTEADPLIPRVDADAASKPSRSAEEKDGSELQPTSYLRSPVWWVGIGMMIAGEAGNFLAYGFAPASVVSPLGVVALISNCLIAPLLLGERFRFRDGLGVVIAVAGCVTVVLSAQSSDPKLDPHAIWSLISRWEFATYVAVTVVLIIVLVVASNTFGDKTILIDVGLVGLFGGYTALATKGLASLISNAVWRVVTFPITYLLLAILILTAVLQIRYINRALQRFSATMVIPTQFVLFTLSVIIGSAILYRDFERETPTDAAKFFGGCALTFLGVWCITSGRKDDEDEEIDDEEGEEEDAVDLIDEEGAQPEIREREDGMGRKGSLIASSSTVAAPYLGRHQTVDALPTYTRNTSSISPSAGPQPIDLNAAAPGYETVPPAVAAAVHASDATPLQLSPPSADRTSDKPQPPPMHATTSAPAVPTTTDSTLPPRPHTPLSRPSSHRPSTTKPSPRGPQAQPHSLDAPPTTPNRLALARHSIAGFLPTGPVMASPLSGSLQAVVADSLRRGPHAALRRRSSHHAHTVTKRTPSRHRRSMPWASAAAAAFSKRHSIASGEMDWPEGESDGAAADGPVSQGRNRDAATATATKGRVRSLSATLGDMFGTRSRRDAGAD